ncbi:MAG: hypothetical protein ABSH48_02025 [Verrucomicrobiota bacterium]
MTIDQNKPDNLPAVRRPRLELETGLALAGTAALAILFVLTAINAGPLWRDETNTINVAQMPSLRELWSNMSFESFPPLWPLLLRGCCFLGLAGSDVNIRLLGLYVGFLFLGSLWLSARWIGCRAPILSIALLGSLPAFVFIVGANRAYGLACCLLLLSFAAIWRLVELPSRRRVLLAGIAGFLFVNCVYYDVIFLAAMLAGGAAVALRRRQWKTLAALAGIGAASSASLAIYLPIIRRGSSYVHLIQWPLFRFATLWDHFREAVTARSSAERGQNGPEIWLWILLLLGGSIVALVMQRTGAGQKSDPPVTTPAVRSRADLALFCVVSMLLGVLGLFAFLFRLHYLTQTWYYIEMICLCAISLDGLLGANWPALRPWGLLRIGFLAVLMSWGGRSVWAEAHTRRSNVDLIAAVLDKNAVAGDMIVVQTVWEGITFNRYYHGPAHWVTLPPIDSHLVHRNDLVFMKMKEPEPMAPVLAEMVNTLHAGHNVWVVGHMSYVRSEPSPAGQPWFVSHVVYWSAQVTDVLMEHALQRQVLEVPTGGPVCLLENLPLIRFSGYVSRPAGPPGRK